MKLCRSRAHDTTPGDDWRARSLQAFQKKLQEVSEAPWGPGPVEEAVVLVANSATKEMIRSADEELFDVWFEKMPTLDVPSVAQLVTFSVLCLYHMRRWSNIIVLCRGFNDATCSVYATTFLPLMIGVTWLGL
eukprot:Skav216745  [mRNA]  locus=scaffold178:266444:272417:+ [translate_table: standard]